ncbi:MAG: DUF883 family protein [Proteobacteria bacterium]|nr:DUF883 family protein [Pseudomonadota bacterium]
MSTADESTSTEPSPAERPASHLRAAAGHVGQARDHLSSGVREARADFSSGVSQARDHLSTGMNDAMGSGREAAREAKAELDDKLEKLFDQSKDLFAQAEDVIRSRPWTSFGAAFAAGFLIARLTRRN